MAMVVVDDEPGSSEMADGVAVRESDIGRTVTFTVAVASGAPAARARSVKVYAPPGTDGAIAMVMVTRATVVLTGWIVAVTPAGRFSAVTVTSALGSARLMITAADALAPCGMS